jgi:hypothetical protein
MVESHWWPDEVEALVALSEPSPDGRRRAPWNWAALTAEECTVMEGMLQGWVDCFNQTVAVTEDDLIPPCWLQHAGLAYELAAIFWLWFGANIDRDATLVKIAEYYARYLPSFRSRLTAMLGASPRECRQGSHPRSWRSKADTLLRSARDRGLDHSQFEAEVDQLHSLNHGFSYERGI